MGLFLLSFMLTWNEVFESGKVRLAQDFTVRLACDYFLIKKNSNSFSPAVINSQDKELDHASQVACNYNEASSKNCTQKTLLDRI